MLHAINQKKKIPKKYRNFNILPIIILTSYRNQNLNIAHHCQYKSVVFSVKSKVESRNDSSDVSQILVTTVVIKIINIITLYAVTCSPPLWLVITCHYFTTVHV